MREVFGQLAMGWGSLGSTESYAATQKRTARQEALHVAAVSRRRKAKRGGKR